MVKVFCQHLPGDTEYVTAQFSNAVNDAITQIDKETEEKMGKYTQGLPGLF